MEAGLNCHFKAMALTIEEVRKIAALARLRFNPEEEAVLAGQLGRIVAYIDQLQRYESGSEAEAIQGAPESEDVPGECIPREQFLANAPAAMDGFLLVPEIKTGGSSE